MPALARSAVCLFWAMIHYLRSNIRADTLTELQYHFYYDPAAKNCIKSTAAVIEMVYPSSKSQEPSTTSEVERDQ